MKITAKVILVLFFVFLYAPRYTCLAGRQALYAKPEPDGAQLSSLSKRIIEAKSCEELYGPYEELKDMYFQSNSYTEFVSLLKSLSAEGKACLYFNNYYIALSRYQQLKYLEETQGWDEYFSQGNAYREELTQNAQAAIEATTAKDKLNISSRLLLWQFHKGQNDAFEEGALSDLMNASLGYSNSSKELKAVKEVADTLSSLGEKGKARELYKMYTFMISSSDIKDEELKNIAAGFYNEANLDLSEAVFDVYTARLMKGAAKEKLLPALLELAGLFAYKDDGPSDPFYAEGIFRRIEQSAGKAGLPAGRQAFSPELIYLRALNLEKSKEYAQAKSVYAELAQTFPENIRAAEAIYKAGIISAYVLRDVKGARAYFEKLGKEEQSLSSQGISALYQLGLISEWEADLAGAKIYFNKLIEKAGAGFPETAGKAYARLKEIEEGKPLEYNLKKFLDLAFKEETAAFDMSKVDLKCRPCKAGREKSVEISASVSLPQTGCMQVELEYLWSGDFGGGSPQLNAPSFSAAFAEAGTKVINLVATTPAGAVDRALVFVDIE